LLDKIAGLGRLLVVVAQQKNLPRGVFDLADFRSVSRSCGWASSGAGGGCC